MCLKVSHITYLIFFIIISSPCISQNKLELQGVDDEIEQNIRRFLHISQLPCDSQADTVNQYLNNLSKKARKAIQPFGYYSPQIETQPAKKQKDCWLFQLKVTLGSISTYTSKKFKITGEGQDDPNFVKVSQKFDTTIGTKLNHQKYENLKSNLLDIASQYGYLEAQFIVNQIDVYPENNTAELELHFDTGPRYKIASIELIQDPVFLDSAFIQKLIPLSENDFFTNKKLFELRKKLTSSAYFDTVSIDLDYQNTLNNKIPVVIKLTPSDRIKYSTGIGYSTDTGARLSFDYNHFRISKFGYQLQSKISLSEVISEFSTTIKFPSKSNPANKWYNLESGFRSERSDNVSSDASKLALSQTRIHTSQWQNINYLDLVQEKDSNTEITQSSILLISGTSWTYISTDNLSRPKRGFRVQADLKASSDSIVSDVSFLQLKLGFKGIFPLGQNRIIYRSQIGSTWTDDFEQLPSNYRFYTGGDNSIRGFDYHTIAPTNEDGLVLGAKNLFSASLEYEHKIANQWAIALFSDVGNAFNNDFQLKKSIGTGLRWFSPIGPVRMDLGFPLDDEDNNFQIHLTVGPDL